MLIVSDLQELFVRIQMLLKAVQKVQVRFRNLVTNAINYVKVNMKMVE